MKTQVKTWKMFVWIVAIVFVLIMVKVAFGETVEQKLSREEQIQIMRECIHDADKLVQSAYPYFPGTKKRNNYILIDQGRYNDSTTQNLSRLAIAFFQYRTKDR